MDRKAFVSIPKCLDIENQKIPVIITGCRPTSWMCGETCHLSFSSPEKKASGVLGAFVPNPPLADSFVSVSPLMGFPAARTSVVTPPPIRYISQPPFSEKHLLAACAVVEREKGNGKLLVILEGNSEQLVISHESLYVGRHKQPHSVTSSKGDQLFR